MKKIIIICLLSLAISVNGQWTIQNPIVGGNTLNDVQFLNENEGWIVGNAGTILHTTDGGLNWNALGGVTSKDLLSLDFLNENEGWIQGDGIILHTNDRGETWQIQIDCSARGMSAVCFTDQDNGWAEGVSRGFATWGSQGVYFETIMHTTNGGQTWQPSDRISDNIVSLCFMDPNHGWVASNWFYYDDIISWSGGDISFTSDGGITLTEQNAGSVINSLFFLDTLNGWAVGSDLVYTTNGGSNWITINDIQGNDVFFADPDNGWIVGKEGRIIHSSDGGGSWTDQNSGISNYLNAVWFSEAKTGWAVGDKGVILKTDDGGVNWTPCFEPTFNDNLYSVFSFDGSNCIATGYNYQQSIIAKTANGGETWESIYHTGFNIKDVTFTDNLTGWAVGYDSVSQGLILKTVDGGINWEQKLMDSRPLNTIFFINEEKGWAARANGLIWKTTDSGDTWDYQYSGINATLNSVFFVDENVGWVVGSGAAIGSTVDGGETWTDRSLDFYHDLFDAWFINADEGWIVGDFGMLHTADGGTTWDIKHKDMELYAICFTDSINGWVVGRYGMILKTNDAGINWELQESGTSKSLFDIDFSDLHNGWAVGLNGTILYTDNGGLLWSPEQDQQKSAKEIYSYPNPFTTSTTLEYTFHQPQTLTITFYNQFGKQVDIIEERRQSGLNRIVWTPENLPNGIYYFRLEAGNHSASGKLVLMR